MTTQTQHSGFTLIEVVVALALLGLIAASVFEGLRFGQRSYSQVVRNGRAQWDVYASQRLIRNLIEGAYPLEPSATGSVPTHGIDGRSDTLSAVAPAPMAQSTAGLYRYEITLRPRARGSNDLVIRWWPQFAHDSGIDVRAAQEEVLLESVASLQWTYRDSGGTEDSTAWLPLWDRQALPALVRVQVGFAADDSRRWPDLVVAPRLTDDANCEFDVVAQRCRSSS